MIGPDTLREYVMPKHDDRDDNDGVRTFGDFVWMFIVGLGILLMAIECA